jgi:hypothetical protein
VPEVPDLSGPLLTQDASQVGRPETRVEGADARAGLTEARVICGDGDVAEHVKHVPPTDGDAVDSGDHRLRNLANHAVQGFDLEETGLARPVVPGLLTLLLVSTGAEGPISGSGQTDHADLVVGPGRLEGPDQLVHGSRTKCIHAVGTIDGDPRESAIHLETHVAQILSLHALLLRRESGVLRLGQCARG